MNTGGPDIGFGNDTIDRLVQLEMEVKRLRKENQKLLGNTQDLMEENKRLRDVISEHKKGSKEQIEYVDSLKSLAVQDREWLDLQMSHRRSRMTQTKKATEATLAKRRSTMSF